MKPRIVLALVFALAACTPALGLNSETNRHSLRGLTGVGVQVEELDPEASRDGLTKKAIQADVELRLRRAGIRVLPKEEWSITSGLPFLYVSVGLAKSRSYRAYAVSIAVPLPGTGGRRQA